MPRVTETDIQRMRDQLFFEGPEERRRLSRFWILLVLAGIIASAGVVADSTATVIGAMIVAPLMTPILGTMLAIVLADRLNLLRSITYVVTGALVVIAIGFVIGLAIAVPTVAETNAQVAARVAPRLIDLVAALATGAVGAFALTRSDVSDTLPGVAIAISLVPPLAVVGLTLESGAAEDAAGALLLFVTNVSAILASGVVVMALYRVYEHLPTPDAKSSYVNRKGAIGAIAVMVVLVMIPLAATSTKIGSATLDEMTVKSTADAWAAPSGWIIVSVATVGDQVTVRATGPVPEPDPTTLRAALDAQGLRDLTVDLELVPGNVVVLPGS